MRRYRRSMRRRRLWMRRRRRSAWRHRRSARRRRRSRGVIGDCGVGTTPQMCNRVTNHGDMSTFSKPVQYGFFFLGLNVHFDMFVHRNGPSVTVQQIFEFVHCPFNLAEFQINGISCVPCEPYWNLHGTDQAMTFGAYVPDFGALIGA